MQAQLFLQASSLRAEGISTPGPQMKTDFIPGRPETGGKKS